MNKKNIRGVEGKGAILVTGATGFLGSHVLFTALREGRRVIALARPADGLPARERLERLASLHGVRGDDLAELRVVEGDITRDRLGASGADWKMIARETRSIFHCAAVTDLTESNPRRLLLANVEGAKNVAELARVSGAVLHHVSSAYVAGRRRGTAREDELDVGQRFNNTYERSKCEGEKAVRRICREGDVPFMIFRPSIIVGDSRTGFTTCFNNLYSLMRVLWLMGRHNGVTSLRISALPTAVKNLVPVDYVAGAIWKIAGMESPRGRTFHITHPNPPTLIELRDIFRELFGIPRLDCASDEDFRRVPPSGIESSIALALTPFLPYFREEPVFDRMHTDEALAGTGGSAPARLDLPFFSRLLDFALSVDWGRRLFAPCAAERDSRPFAVDYFERFLASRRGRPLVARARGFEGALHVHVTDAPGPGWSLVIKAGNLERIAREGRGGDCGFRMNSATLREIAGARLSPQQAFFARRVEIWGDMEKALSFASIIAAFVRENAYAAGGRGGGGQ